MLCCGVLIAKLKVSALVVKLVIQTRIAQKKRTENGDDKRGLNTSVD